MRTIPILSSVIIVVGCFMPWMQLGALYTNRGIDNPDGAVMLVTAIISGGLAFYNYSQKKPKNTWIYFVVGVIGFITAYIDLDDVTSRAKTIAESLGQVNSFFGGNGSISLMNFVGSGLYIVCGGSIGLILSGIGIFKFEQNEQPNIETTQNNEEIEDVEEIEEASMTKKCPDCAETIKREARICRYCRYKFSEDELRKVEAEKENKVPKDEEINNLIKLNKLIISEKNKFFGGRMTDEIQAVMDILFKTKEDSIRLLKIYKSIIHSDLIDDLKKINTSYSAIKRNVSIFIHLDIIEETFPHNQKK